MGTDLLGEADDWENGLSKPATKCGRVQRNVLDLLRKHRDDDALPTSGRFVFYELEQIGLATKPSPDDIRPNKRRNIGWPPGGQDITDAITYLRERGIIRWDAIVDEMRHLSAWRSALTIASYLVDSVDLARINPWGTMPAPLLLCESRATSGVLERVAFTYCCPITGTGGQCAGFLRTEVAPYLIDGQCILYLGDLDRSGADIENNARHVLEEATGFEFDWHRLAMTTDLAAEHNITPIWKVDGRDRRGHEAIEVESLGQAALVRLVDASLVELLPEPLARVLEREREQRTAVAATLDRLNDGGHA